MKYTILSLLAVAALITGVGCAALSEYLTPATIDRRAVAYAAAAGVTDANDFKGWANLEKAIRLEVAVTDAFEVKSLALEQMQEKNQLDYGILNGVVVNNRKIARSREEQLFGETGLLSMGLGLLGVGGLGGILGLSRKRPGDWTPEEVDSALAEVKTGETVTKRQFVEVVKGVQAYLNTHSDDESAVELKTVLGMAQSADTRQAVAVIKAVV